MTPRNPQCLLKPINALNVAISLCFCALATTSTASEQLPHQHGHARLQMAVENNSIDLILTSPAHNLLGFEHQPRTQEQKQTLENARQWLTTQALIAPDAGNCTVKSASMSFNAKATEQEQDHGHGHGHEESHNEANNEHSNIEVSQRLDCAGTDLRGRFATPLTGQFPEIQNLSVEWVTNSAQGSAKLSAPNNHFRL
jgi:hypothetical protein